MKNQKIFLFKIILGLLLVFFAQDSLAFSFSKKPQNRYYESEIIRFSYPPDTEVHEWKNVIYLTQVGQEKPIFVVFPPHKNVKIKGVKNFYCETKKENLEGEELGPIRYEDPFRNKKNLKKPKTRWCYSQPEKLGLVSDITLFPERSQGLELTREKLKKIRMERDRVWVDYQPYQTMTRADFLNLVIRWRYPDRDFSSWSSRCFKDVNLKTPHVGIICWAKDKKIIQGIYDHFYPDSSVNIWGVLQILTRTFETDLSTKNIKNIPSKFFQQMSRDHIAASLLGGAWSRGILLKTSDDSFWANRAVRQSEILQILTDFWDWRLGRTLRFSPHYEIDSSIQIFYRPDVLFDWEAKKKSKSKYKEKNQNTWLQKKSGKFLLWNQVRPGIFMANGWLPIASNEEVLELKINYNPERFEGEVELLNLKSEKVIFRPNIPVDFFSNKKEADFGKIKTIPFLKFLEKIYQGPCLSVIRKENTLPIWDIYLSELEIKNLFLSPTSNTRYGAFLEVLYQNQIKNKHSIKIKTRGNSTRGYIKPSFTIENFEKFMEIDGFFGDEFLSENNEVKLRSFVNEPTFLREKLFYQTLSTLGGNAPEFFQIMIRINGVPFGVYQVTEPIKKSFFRRRGFEVEDYFYAKNLNAKFNTNLKFYKDEVQTLAGYKIRGDAQKLLDLIYGLEKNDPDLMHWIDIKSVFDYALLVWISDSWDSLTHNYYVFWDLKTQKWNFLAWDADLAWKKTPYKISFEEFNRITQVNTQDNNALIYYVFQHLSDSEKKVLWDDFWKTWDQKIDLVSVAREYQVNYRWAFQFDNHLWNGRFLERSQVEVDSFIQIEKLIQRLGEIEKNRVEEGSENL